MKKILFSTVVFVLMLCISSIASASLIKERGAESIKREIDVPDLNYREGLDLLSKATAYETVNIQMSFASSPKQWQELGDYLGDLRFLIMVRGVQVFMKTSIDYDNQSSVVMVGVVCYTNPGSEEVIRKMITELGGADRAFFDFPSKSVIKVFYVNRISIEDGKAFSREEKYSD